MIKHATKALTPRYGAIESPKIARQVVALGSRYSMGFKDGTHTTPTGTPSSGSENHG